MSKVQKYVESILKGKKIRNVVEEFSVFASTLEGRRLEIANQLEVPESDLQLETRGHQYIITVKAQSIPQFNKVLTNANKEEAVLKIIYLLTIGTPKIPVKSEVVGDKLVVTIDSSDIEGNV